MELYTRCTTSSNWNKFDRFQMLLCRTGLKRNIFLLNMKEMTEIEVSSTELNILVSYLECKSICAQCHKQYNHISKCTDVRRAVKHRRDAMSSSFILLLLTYNVEIKFNRKFSILTEGIDTWKMFRNNNCYRICPSYEQMKGESKNLIKFR